MSDLGRNHGVKGNLMLNHLNPASQRVVHWIGAFAGALCLLTGGLALIGGQRDFSVVALLISGVLVLVSSIIGLRRPLADLQMSAGSKLPRLSGEELKRLLDEESSSESTYAGTYPRADIYRDHD